MRVAPLATLAVTVLIAPAARAEAPPSPVAVVDTPREIAAPPRDVAAPPRDPTAYRHDGGYLRVAMGFGEYEQWIMHRSGKQIGVVTGFATATEVAFGWTTSAHTVVGGGMWTTAANLTQSRASTSEPLPPSAGGVPTSTLIGAFADHYVDPTRGLHLQFAMGLAVLGDQSRSDSSFVGIGGGVMAGAGYEWWVSEQWSAGILVRETFALTTGREDGTRYLQLAGSAPSLLLSVTNH